METLEVKLIAVDIQGDPHGGLTLGFVHFDMGYYSVCFLLVKTGQRWHGKLVELPNLSQLNLVSYQHGHPVG